MKRAAPKTVRKKAGKSTKKKKLTTGKLLKYSFLLLLVCTIAGVAFNYRHGVLYWLGFKTNKRLESLTKEERKIENLRIYEIVGRHKHKVFGIDVSHYQGRINWDSVQKSNLNFPLHFVFIRATAGKNGKDSAFKTNWSKAKEYGFIRGAYHYYRPDENSIEQAEYFIKTVKLTKGDLPPVLDIEKIPQGQSMERLKLGLTRWLDRVEEHYGVRPIIYSGESYYTDFLKDEFADYEMWIANYNFFVDEIKPEWLFWQFTDKGTVAGIEGDVDVNIFNGDAEGLKALRLN